MNHLKSKLLYGVLHTTNNELLSVANELSLTISPIVHCFLFTLSRNENIDCFIDTVWFSQNENSWFRLNHKLQNTNVESIIVGISIDNEVCIWGISDLKTYLLDVVCGQDVSNIIKSFHIPCDDFVFEWNCLNCNDNNAKHHLRIFKHNIKQYNYRYCILFNSWNHEHRNWNKNEYIEDCHTFNFMEEVLFDSTHDKLHNGDLMKFHEAGIPKKLAMKWYCEKSDYSAYFWFKNEEICAIFNKFYGQHPDTKTDFIIHIDPIKKKYELSLYRYGLKEPFIIPQSAYQLIVFKSGFENYRSDNYNQPTGAWIW